MHTQPAQDGQHFDPLAQPYMPAFILETRRHPAIDHILTPILIIFIYERIV